MNATKWKRAKIMGKKNERVTGSLAILGKNIAAARKERRISQLSLAIASGVSKSYLCDVEHGRRNISVLLVIKIAEALDVSPSSLLEGIPDKGENK